MSEAAVISLIFTWPPSAFRGFGGSLDGRRGGDGYVRATGGTAEPIGGDEREATMGGDATLGADAILGGDTTLGATATLGSDATLGGDATFGWITLITERLLGAECSGAL